MSKFSHLDKKGNVKMVDVTDKPTTERTARAEGKISMKKETLALLLEEELPKGNVLTTAKLAGIQAAKKTSNLIPLCHPLNVSWVDIEFESERDHILILRWAFEMKPVFEGNSPNLVPNQCFYCLFA